MYKIWRLYTGHCMDQKCYVPQGFEYPVRLEEYICYLYEQGHELVCFIKNDCWYEIATKPRVL